MGRASDALGHRGGHCRIPLPEGRSRGCALETEGQREAKWEKEDGWVIKSGLSTLPRDSLSLGCCPWSAP